MTTRGSGVGGMFTDVFMGLVLWFAASIFLFEEYQAGIFEAMQGMRGAGRENDVVAPFEGVLLPRQADGYFAFQHQGQHVDGARVGCQLVAPRKPLEKDFLAVLLINYRLLRPASSPLNKLFFCMVVDA